MFVYITEYIHFTQEYIHFIHTHALKLPTCQDVSVFPDILIDIDHYWDVLTLEAPMSLP